MLRNNTTSSALPSSDGNSKYTARKIAILALLIALAILLGYVETLIPLNLGVPGVKSGLCNIVILVTMLLYSWREALLVSVARVLVIGFMFGNLYSITYGLAGTVCSILIMSVLLATRQFGLIGVSAAGGSAHNIGQLLVAKLVLPALPLFWYVPVLLLAGLATGAIIGTLTYGIYTRIKGVETL